MGDSRKMKKLSTRASENAIVCALLMDQDGLLVARGCLVSSRVSLSELFKPGRQSWRRDQWPIYLHSLNSPRHSFGNYNAGWRSMSLELEFVGLRFVSG
jgi:hypothetical protein